MTSQKPINALILAENEPALALDRKVLRRLGVTQSVFFSSGRKALEHLQAIAALQTVNGPATPTSVDMVISNERLADMTGLQFLSQLRSQAGCERTPALLLVGNGQSTTAVAARATNSCAVLARPYSLDNARAALVAAAQPEMRTAPMSLPPSFTDRFGPNPNRNTAKPLINRKEQIPPRIPGEAALHQGLAALKRGDVRTADNLLHGSYEADPNRVETSLALSRLYAFLHKEKEELSWLCKAGVLCLKRGEKMRASTIFSRLPRGKSGQTPLLAEAGLVLQTGEAKAAALSFLEAHRLDPAQALHVLIGRTCMFTPAPEEHMRELIAALSKAGHDATANKLHWRLLQPAKAEGEDTRSFLDQFPMLCDIFSVAAHTFKTWRLAA